MWFPWYTCPRVNGSSAPQLASPLTKAYGRASMSVSMSGKLSLKTSTSS